MMGKASFPAFHSFGSIFARGYEHEEILPVTTGFVCMEYNMGPAGNDDSPYSGYA